MLRYGAVMSPIFVRPVREQLEHDRLIRHLQAKYTRKSETATINVGEEQVVPVKIGEQMLFADLVVSDGKKLTGLVEVETGESTNNLEAMAQWVHFSRARVPFHLYVPVQSYESARRLCDTYQARITELWTYRGTNDGGFDLVMMSKDPAAPNAGRGPTGRIVPLPPKPKVEPPPPPPPPPPAPVTKLGARGLKSGKPVKGAPGVAAPVTPVAPVKVKGVGSKGVAPVASVPAAGGGAPVPVKSAGLTKPALPAVPPTKGQVPLTKSMPTTATKPPTTAKAMPVPAAKPVAPVAKPMVAKAPLKPAPTAKVAKAPVKPAPPSQVAAPVKTVPAKPTKAGKPAKVAKPAKRAKRAKKRARPAAKKARPVKKASKRAKGGATRRK